MYLETFREFTDRAAITLIGFDSVTINHLEVNNFNEKKNKNLLDSHTTLCGLLIKSKSVEEENIEKIYYRICVIS